MTQHVQDNLPRPDIASVLACCLAQLPGSALSPRQRTPAPAALNFISAVLFVRILVPLQ
jgi:hypothetical protein